ncbi:hypothetical protein CONPUDRAFT_77123 [Coniophora puteana RWD-64-598 SS2]|uniref:Uncharacterized protein n=1 Tax=Coniophora puteana (strain RWD-64-598) TaxID=741705 RepID=A0A5M3M927_CONPW|nr:uncharacterized protein CONPUDRAFT_77123 [Coniophora puteana RWD-64-598 SS2]EIW75426.1 hypothetical protein CONPUDRAFT_77123 [Coniophora puteana RWD-64-598 SS2]
MKPSHQVDKKIVSDFEASNTKANPRKGVYGVPSVAIKAIKVRTNIMSPTSGATRPLPAQDISWRHYLLRVYHAGPTTEFDHIIPMMDEGDSYWVSPALTLLLLVLREMVKRIFSSQSSRSRGFLEGRRGGNTQFRRNRAGRRCICETWRIENTGKSRRERDRMMSLQ